MSGDGSGKGPTLPYRGTSKREEAVTIVISLSLGLATYFLLTGIRGASRAVEGIPASPGLIAIVVALVGYFLLEAWLLDR